MTESLYFLAIIPPIEVGQEIWAYKELVFEKFNSKASLNSPAHITLHMPFKWKAKKEEILIDKLSKFNFDEFPVFIQLNGFDFFPPRVIFINVEDNARLNHLQSELSRYIKKELNIFNADYKNRPFHPHVTVAFRDLKKSVFLEAETFFSKERYQTKFKINQICLLKHNGKKWEEFYNF